MTGIRATRTYWFSGQLGPVTDQGGSLGQMIGPQRRYAEETAREIDMEVRDLVEGAFWRARRLLEKGTLSDGELAEVLGKVAGKAPRAA